MAAEQIAALQQALMTAQAHTAQLSKELDQVKADSLTALNAAKSDKAELDIALAVLRRDSESAVATLQRNIQESGGRRDGQSTSGLLNLKHFEPKTFGGKDSEDVKPWAKRMRSYCNAKRPGYKIAMEWAELQKEPVTTEDLELMEWEYAVRADTELYEFLQMTTAGDASIIVERHKEHGFEAWRALIQRYNPKGGRFELERMNSLLKRKQCKTLSEVPAAVDMLEKEIEHYEARNNQRFPQEFKIPLLLQLLPGAHREQLELKFSMGEKDYAKIAANIVGYSNDQRVVK